MNRKLLIMVVVMVNIVALVWLANVALKFQGQGLVSDTWPPLIINILTLGILGTILVKDDVKKVGWFGAIVGVLLLFLAQILVFLFRWLLRHQ